MTEFENKTVFATGGAYGLGRAVVTAFTTAGVKVGFMDIAEQRARTLWSSHARTAAK